MTDTTYVRQLEAEIERLRQFAVSQKCRCRYYGDGDWSTCNRCRVLGVIR